MKKRNFEPFLCYSPRRARAGVTWSSKLHNWKTKSDKKVSKNGF